MGWHFSARFIITGLALKGLRGTVLFLEIVFVGWCEVFVCL